MVTVPNLSHDHNDISQPQHVILIHCSLCCLEGMAHISNCCDSLAFKVVDRLLYHTVLQLLQYYRTINRPSPLTQHRAGPALKALVEKCSAVTSCWTKVTLCPLFCSGLARRQNKTAAHFLYPVCAQAPPLLPGPTRLRPTARHFGHSAGALPPSPRVNKLSLCHVKHAAGASTLPTLCYCQTSAALFRRSTQSFPPVAAHSLRYYSFHSPVHLRAHVRSLLDCPASRIQDEGGWGPGP